MKRKYTIRSKEEKLAIVKQILTGSSVFGNQKYVQN